MKTKKYNAMKNLLFLSFLFIGILSCKDRDPDPNVLPEATQSGKNTGGALVDGKVWVAKIEQPGLNTYYEFVNGEYKLQITLKNVENPDGNNIVINLTSDQDFAIGDYQLDDMIYNRGLYSNSYGGYTTDNENTGILSITKFDKTNKIISGTFSFKAKYYYDGSIVTISEGRFDKKFL